MGIGASHVEQTFDIVMGREGQRKHDIACLTLQLAADKEIAVMRETHETSRSIVRYLSIACGTLGCACAAWYMYKQMNQRLEAADYYRTNLEVCKLWQKKREFEVNKAIEVGLPNSQLVKLLSGDAGPPFLASPRIVDFVEDAQTPRRSIAEDVGSSNLGKSIEGAADPIAADLFASSKEFTHESAFTNVPVVGFSTKVSENSDGSETLEVECPGVLPDQVRIIRLSNAVHIYIDAVSDTTHEQGAEKQILFEYRHRLSERDGIHELREDEITLEHGLLRLVFRPAPPQLVRLSSGTSKASFDGLRTQYFCISKNSELATDGASEVCGSTS